MIFCLYLLLEKTKKMKYGYQRLMNSKEVEIISSDWNRPILKGTLVGFKELGLNYEITSAYPVIDFNGEDVSFIVDYYEDGSPVIDKEAISNSNLFINKEPIVIEITSEERQKKLSYSYVDVDMKEVIGAYTEEGENKEYTKQSLKGDVAILSMDVVSSLLSYMKENGYDDVYITPLITEIQNKHLKFLNRFK